MTSQNWLERSSFTFTQSARHTATIIVRPFGHIVEDAKIFVCFSDSHSGGRITLAHTQLQPVAQTGESMAVIIGSADQVEEIITDRCIIYLTHHIMSLQHVTAGALCELNSNGQLEMAPAHSMSIIITVEDIQGLNRERTVEVEVSARTVEQPGLFLTGEELFEDGLFGDCDDSYSDYMESRD